MLWSPHNKSCYQGPFQQSNVLESLNLMLKIKSLNKSIPLSFILSSLKNYRHSAERIGAGIVSFLSKFLLSKYNGNPLFHISNFYWFIIAFLIRKDQKGVSCGKTMAPNPLLVFWLEEAEDGCIFDEQTKVNSRTLLAKAFIIIIKWTKWRLYQ